MNDDHETAKSAPVNGQTKEEKYYLASQWQLMVRKLKRHKLALAGLILLALMYSICLTAGFSSPYLVNEQNLKMLNAPPQRIRFYDGKKLHMRPFVYGTTQSLNPVTLRRVYTINREAKHFIHFFHRSGEYRLWGLFPTNVHLFGVRDGTCYLFGTDSLGRDLFSRTLYAGRLSLTIGIVGVALSFVLGCVLGGISGYFGGTIDMIIQRIIEFLLSIPTIPLWMSLGAALPRHWSVVKVYFGITVILSIVGWCGLARVVRGKILELREEDFIMAARISAMPERFVIVRHLLPSFISYLIVHLTLAVPGMILAETALSFLNLGLRPPAVSWGVLLQEAQNIRTVALQPWLLIPAGFVIMTVLLFNFFGDGLRDAADPYR